MLHRSVRFSVLVLLLSVAGAAVSLAQTLTSLTYEVVQGVGRITIVGNGFSSADEVVVAGIPLEVKQASESRIEAVLPSSVKLVGGSYTVRISGKQKTSGTLVVK